MLSRARGAWLAVCLVLALLRNVSLAEDAGTAFDAANKLYEQGKFSEAAAAYEKLALSGRSAAVFFNLGNAFFKLAQIGRSVAAYRQAEALTPRDPDVRANLQFARKQVQGPTLTPSMWQRWLGRLSLNEWSLLAAVSFWVWMLALAAAQWRPALRPGLRPVMMAFALLTAIFGCCLAAGWSQSRGSQIAVVISHDAAVRHGPLDESPTAFTVHDGAELLVLDQKDQWLQVTTDSQRLGWVRRDQVIVVPKA